jgi:hypothetical protein
MSEVRSTTPPLGMAVRKWRILVRRFHSYLGRLSARIHNLVGDDRAEAEQRDEEQQDHREDRRDPTEAEALQPDHDRPEHEAQQDGERERDEDVAADVERADDYDNRADHRDRRDRGRSRAHGHDRRPQARMSGHGGARDPCAVSTCDCTASRSRRHVPLASERGVRRAGRDGHAAPGARTEAIFCQLEGRGELEAYVTFHDDTPFTAADVVFSIERARAETSDLPTLVGGSEALLDQMSGLPTAGCLAVVRGRRDCS